MAHHFLRRKDSMTNNIQVLNQIIECLDYYTCRTSALGPHHLHIWLFSMSAIVNSSRAFYGAVLSVAVGRKSKTEHVRRYIWVVKKEMDEMNDNELLANICFAKYIPSS